MTLREKLSSLSGIHLGANTFRAHIEGIVLTAAKITISVVQPRGIEIIENENNLTISSINHSMEIKQDTEYIKILSSVQNLTIKACE